MSQTPKENQMRKIIVLSLVFVFLFAVVARAEGNIAVFDKQKVAAESDPLKAARASLESKFGVQRGELEKERVDLESRGMAFQRITPTEKQAQDFMRQQEIFSEKAQAFMRLLQADETRILRDMDMLIDRAAKEFAERKGYVLILDSLVAAYFDPKLDVTADMIGAVNALWKKETGQ
jgi:outer membrane protein